MARRYPLLLSIQELDAFVALAGHPVPQDECFAQAQALSSTLAVCSSSRFEDRSWGWILGLVLGAVTSGVHHGYPSGLVLTLAASLVLAGLVLAGLQWRPMNLALDTNLEVSWVGGLFVSRSTGVEPTPVENRLEFENGAQESASAAHASEEGYLCMGHGIDVTDPPDLMPLDNLLEISLAKRGLLFRARRQLLHQLHQDLVPDLFALGGIVAAIAICLQWTNSSDESTAGMTRIVVGLLLGRAASSLTRVASRWVESRQRWRRQVVLERLFVAAIAGVPATVLPRLVARYEKRGDLVFATAERIGEERLKGRL